ncbi:hypothetical protein [Methylobacterium sp. Leaf399]|uniref:hypothetical protein n=2 Tax=unclassified Methylobacterium TaxID=2615210 RepID=UPI000A6E88DC|nr:hypothetical protein [Methylobacterium sp. Leaf399]
MTDRTWTMRNATLRGMILAVGLAGSAIPASAGDVATLHATWRGCLERSFSLQAVLTSRTLAADTAVRTCRESETAYLAALSTSPLVDDDDVARVRPALLQRARGWLLGVQTTQPL